MAAAAYNLKKLLKFTKTPPKSVANSAQAGQPLALLKTAFTKLFLSQNAEPKFCMIKV